MVLELDSLTIDYFKLGRPSFSLKFIDDCLEMFPNHLNKKNLDEGIFFAKLFFLMVYTSTRKNLHFYQVEIYQKVMLKFHFWLKKQVDEMKFSKLDWEAQDCFLLYLRHGIINGSYAPSKVMLVNAINLKKAYPKSRIEIICEETITEDFLKVAEQNEIIVSRIGGSELEKLILLSQRLLELKPRYIFTEMEISPLSLLYTSGLPVPVVYHAQGFYANPLCDVVGLPDYLRPGPHEILNRINFRRLEYGTTLGFLRGELDGTQRLITRSEMKIHPEQIVVGNFARYEKFSVDYLRFLRRLAQVEKRLVLFIAGPNDQAVAIRELESIPDYQKRIYPKVDVHKFGWAFDLAIDTFPFPAGFSSLEIQAKGIPVCCFKMDDAEILSSQREPEWTCESELDAMKKILDFCNIPVAKRLSTEPKGPVLEYLNDISICNDLREITGS